MVLVEWDSGCLSHCVEGMFGEVVVAPRQQQRTAEVKGGPAEAAMAEAAPR